jgi:hypothetical protein
MKFKIPKPNYTPEMEEWFIKRTQNHINAVQSYCKKIEAYDPERFSGLTVQAIIHDQSKFQEPERTPYIFTTWGHRCKGLGIPYEPPEEMKGPMVDAMAHHIKNNKHHTEYWSNLTDNLVNPDALYEMSQVIDASKMPDMYIAEMIADWFAVGKERHNPVKWWADKNVNVRWMFTPEQTKLIYDLVENIK